MTETSNLDFIYRLGDETRNLTEPEDIMAAVATAVGRHLSVSRCAYADVESDGNRFTIYRDYINNCPSTAGKYELTAFGERAVSQLRRGETLIISDVDSELTAEDGGDTFRAIGIKAIICCALVKAGRLVAMMAVHQTEKRQWQEEEIDLLQEVVERCWSTIERARAQKLALRNEQKFKDLFEHAPDAQVLIDHNGNIQLANIRFREMFRIETGDAVGLSALDLLPAVVVESNLNSDSPFPTNTNLFAQSVPQIVIENSAGEKFYVEINQNLIESEEGTLRELSIRDVSERIRLETELQQAKKIETLGMLAGGIAHDFNNLLTVIIGTAELPLHKDHSDFRFRKEFETIRSVGGKAAELTQQLLAFSRQQVLQPEIIDVNAAVRSSQDIIARLIGENITVQLDLDDKSLHANLDKSQFGQVLMNLAANARDAMRDGGRLTITTRHAAQLPEALKDSSSSSYGFVQLAVSDTGNGMSEEEVAKIFDPFYTTKRSGKGTGLGLSTVYGIISQSDGRILVQSELGVGTSFEMYFPVVLALDKIVGDADAEESDCNSEKILIVEDEPELLSVLDALLRECGYTVESAGLGQEALELFRNKPGYFDLIITDVIMPGMSGPQFVESARKIRPDIKVIFSSGYTADAIGRHGVLEHDQNFLGKPYRFEVLDSLVRDVLSGT